MNLVDTYVTKVLGLVEHHKGLWDDGTPMNYFTVPVQYNCYGATGEQDICFFVYEGDDEDAIRAEAEAVTVGYHYLS